MKATLSLCIILFLSTQLIYGQKALEILSNIQSFEDLESLEIKDSLNLDTLRLSEHHLINTDGMFSNEQNIYFGDSLSLYAHVEAMKVGQVMELNNDSLTVFHKLVKVDSVLCYNYATIDLGFNYGFVDSVMSYVKQRVKSKQDWNNLPFHLSGRFEEGESIRGSHGWIEKEIFVETFANAIESNNVLDIFLYNYEDPKGYTCIVIKLENEKYFKRYGLIEIIQHH